MITTLEQLKEEKDKEMLKDYSRSIVSFLVLALVLLGGVLFKIILTFLVLGYNLQILLKLIIETRDNKNIKRRK